MKRRITGRRRAGFTLVEIMFVVGIIGILLAVAVPTFVRARESAQAKACQHNLKQILGAKERWAMDNNRGASDTPTMTELAVPGLYMRNLPLCPSGGTYIIGSLQELPTCSIGGTPGDASAHVLP